MTDVAAVIVNFNTRDYLLECVRSLRADGVERIVVVDNASVDGSLDALRRSDPKAEVVATGTNLGFGAAANVGVSSTDSGYVLILNPDTVIEPGTVKALTEALERDPTLAVVGPRIHNVDGTLYPSVRRFPDLGVAVGHAFVGLFKPDNRFTRSYRMLDWDHEKACPVDWVSGTCMLVRRSAFEQVGGFDPAFFMYVEDVDLCWRLWRTGWTVGYEPGGLVTHTIGGIQPAHPLPDDPRPPPVAVPVRRAHDGGPAADRAPSGGRRAGGPHRPGLGPARCRPHGPGRPLSGDPPWPARSTGPRPRTELIGASAAPRPGG